MENANHHITYISNAYGRTRHRASQPFVHQIVPSLCLPRRSGEQHPFLLIISMRPVLCLSKHIPKSKKYWAERPPFLFLRFYLPPTCHPHAWIREQRSKSAHLPDPTHAGTKYPRSGEPLTPMFRVEGCVVLISLIFSFYA